MSGNPFRASLVPKHPTAAPPTSFISVDANRGTETRDERDRDAVLDAPSAQPARIKKSVRIESPTEIILPHSAFHDKDDPLLHVNRSHHAGSPPLVSPAGFSDNFEDIDTDDIQRTEDLHSAGMTGGTRKSTGAPEALPSLSGAPANPFSRTLANIEPQEKASGESAAQNRDRTATEKTATGTTKPSLDVESFKNLLMTGISSPRSSGPPPQAAPAANPISTSVFESSSSTDTSSISRQSIFDPAVQEPHPESPRTSYEMAASDDERIGLVGETKKQKKKPPPAPKHRHGKLVSSRTPQTVSFEGFSATEPTSSPPTSRHKRTDSDLNKPLPPTPPVVSPPAHIISQDITQDSLSISDAKLSDTASLSDASSAQKRIPPPVPIARRQSQLRSSTAGNRSRSNSSLTMSSQHSIELPLLSPGSTQEPCTSSPSQKAPPPPPPSRRHGAALATISTSSANSSTTELSNAANTARRPTVSSPNPPASRRTTISSDPPSPSPGVQRTSSINSNRNANPNRSVSNESTASMPPPPPPPRRRQSGRASLDKERPNMHHQPSSPTESRRTSTEHKRNSIDSKRRTSVASESSLKYEYAPAAESEHVLYSPREEKEDNIEEEATDQANASNILDDMEKFQKEIDELRAKYKEAA